MAELAAGGAEFLGPYMGPVLAALGATCGGVGVKYVDRIFAVREKKVDVQQRMHEELREEVKDLKEFIRGLEKQHASQNLAYTRILIKYNMLRQKSGLTSDLDDATLEAQVEKMVTEASKAADEKKPVTPP